MLNPCHATKSPKLPFWYRGTWSIENHIPKNRRWFWSFTPHAMVGFQKPWGSLRCTLYRRDDKGLGNGNVAHHVWDTGKTNEWWMYFWKKSSSFKGGDWIWFRSTAYHFCTFLARIHDLKLMLEDSLAWAFLKIWGPFVGWLLEECFFFKALTFSVSCG